MIKEYQQQAVALGCNVDLRLVSDTPNEVEDIFKSLWRKVDEFDKRYSRFLSGSLITALNSAGGSKVVINKLDKQLLLKCKSYSKKTASAFNPFVLPAVQRLGYKKSLRDDFKYLPALDYSQRRVADMSELEIGTGWARIPADSAIDIGAIGKGFLADELVKTVKNKVHGLCFSLGGDIALNGLSRDSKPWSVSIQSTSKSIELSTLELPKAIKGVATSGLKRSFQGNVQLHAIDIQTGKHLSSNVVSCTVLAKSATDADVYASAALAGDKTVENLIANNRIAAALLQYRDGAVKVFGEDLFYVHKKHKPDMIEGKHEG